MGNRNSNAADDDWDSDDGGGGSDYEHAYNFHSSVLHKSPADGFESDYEDDDASVAVRSSRRSQQTPPPSAEPAAASVSSDAATPSSGEPGVTPAEERLNSNENNATASAAASATCEPQAQAVSCEEQETGNSPSSSRGNDSKRREHDHSQETLPVRKEPSPHGSSRKENANLQPLSASASVQNGEIRRRQRQAVSCHSTEENRESAAEEAYETAGEGDGDRGVDAMAGSDNDSLSTITPPRTRPQSDSEFSRTADSEEEEEAVSDDNDDDDDDDDDDETASSTSDSSVAEVYPSRSSRKSTPATGQRSQSLCSDLQIAISRSSPPSISQRQIPRRQGMSPNSYRQVRKRVASPKHGNAAKRSKAEGINFSPSRPRLGIFDSESDSEPEPVSHRTTRRSSRTGPTPPQSLPPPPPPQQSRRETRSGLSARSLRQAAKRAASQFVETSMKILQDAKTAARILRKSTSSKRRSSVLLGQDDDDATVGGKRRSFEKASSSSPTSRREAAEQRREERRSQIIVQPVSSRNRGTKRKAEENIIGRTRATRRHQQSDIDTDPEMDALPSNQVRKNGGQLRKFTRTVTTTSSSAFTSMTRHSPRQSVPPSQSSDLAPVPVLASRRARTSPTGCTANSTTASKANSPSTVAANPFHDVTLIPPSSLTMNNSTGSIDSITHELSPLVSESFSGHLYNGPSPFVSLQMLRMEAPSQPTATVGSGSIWSRINTRTSPTNSQTAGAHDFRLPSASPVPGTSGGSVSRRATRSSPQTVAPAPNLSPPYPPQSTPRVPSLTLTGQFAQSGRFAFLLEDVLQVTVTTADITMASTSAVVITTNNQLDCQTLNAENVAKAAGPEFKQACQEYLRHNRDGLQVCEILDTPAGGRLSPLISHVLHVMLPDGNTAGSAPADVKKHKKLLLCSYINCLKYASEKLSLASIAFPLFAAGTYSADECIQVFFDSLLVYLAERTPTCPLHAIHLIVSNPAIGRFAAEVLEARLEAMVMKSVDAAMADVFKEYFNIPDFSRNESSSTGDLSRSPSGKPAVKRRRL